MLRRGFSLIELLVVVAVITVLIGLLVPALGLARQAARASNCRGQMRQVGLATVSYAHDHRDFLPRSSHSAASHGALPWGYALSPYLGQGPYTGPGPAWEQLFNGLYRCPADARRDRWSIGKNVWFELTAGETGEIDGLAKGPVFWKSTSVPRPTATVLFGELQSGSMADHLMAHFWHLGGAPEVDTQRHGDQSTSIFVDGHAETRPFVSTFSPPKVDLWHPGRAQ